MLRLLWTIVLIATTSCYADVAANAETNDNSTPIYKQAGAPIPQRVADLLTRMNLDEKIAQVCLCLPFFLCSLSALSIIYMCVYIYTFRDTHTIAHSLAHTYTHTLSLSLSCSSHTHTLSLSLSLARSPYHSCRWPIGTEV